MKASSVLDRDWKKLLEQERKLRKLVQSPAFMMAGIIARERQYRESLALSEAAKMEGIIAQQRQHWEDLAQSQVVKIAKIVAEQKQLSNTVHNSLPFRMASIPEQQRHPFQGIGHFPAVMAIANAAVKYSTGSSSFRDFPQSFIGQLLSSLNIPYGKTEEADIEEDVRLIEKALNAKCKGQHPKFVSFEGILQIFMAVIFFIYASQSETKNTQMIIEMLDKVEKTLIQKVEQLKPFPVSEALYVALRPVNLRSKPNSKSTSLGFLQANQKVSLMQRNGKWIYVNYFDYIEGISKAGWVYEKHLKQIN